LSKIFPRSASTAIPMPIVTIPTAILLYGGSGERGLTSFPWYLRQVRQDPIRWKPPMIGLREFMIFTYGTPMGANRLLPRKFLWITGYPDLSGWMLPISVIWFLPILWK